MNNTNTIRSLGWLVGLMLFFSWTLQAEGSPRRIDTGHLVQSSEFFKLLAPVDPLPISLTATVGVPFSASLPRTLPIPPGTSTYYLSVTGLPDNGLSKTGSDPGFIVGTPLNSGVMNLTVVETFVASQTVNNATTWRAYTITVNPPRAPISLTATVGVPFSASLSRTLPIPPGTSTYYLSVTGLPDNGLSKTGSDPGFIVGTPLTSGVMNLTVVETFVASQTVNNATTWRAYTITVNPPRAPISLTATVGVPFSASLPRTLPIPPGSSTYTIGVTGLPANGLSQMSIDPAFIVGTPLTSGVMNLTVVETFKASQTVNNATTWRAYTITVNSPRPPISLTATVGVPFSASLPRTLPIPPGTSTYYLSVTGLPDNGLSKTGSDPGFIVGTPLTSGVMNLTVVETFVASQTVNNATTWRAYTITVSPSTPTAPFSITGVTTVSCATVTAGERMLTFTPLYTGVTGQPISFSVVNEMLPTTSPGPYTLRLYTDNPTITLKATQTGSPGEASFTYNWLAVCGGGSPPPPPPTGTFSITGVTTVSCATVTAGERMLTFTPQYTGVTGQPISFSVLNEMLPTSSPGPYTLRLYTDNPTITLKATQTGSPGEASFNYNWLAVCGGGSPPPPPTATFSITGVTTVSCATVTAGERMLTFTPRYAGLDGQPISFSVANEMLPTTSPGPYTLRLYTDNPTITLKATQTGTPGEASFTYNWLAVCNGGGAPRLGVSPEPTAELRVKLLGNPVREAVEVEVTGGENRPLHLSLADMMGRVVGESRTEQAGASETYRFDVSTLPSGTFLLRTSTQGQTKVVRVLKTK